MSSASLMNPTWLMKLVAPVTNNFDEATRDPTTDDKNMAKDAPNAMEVDTEHTDVNDALTQPNIAAATVEKKTPDKKRNNPPGWCQKKPKAKRQKTDADVDSKDAKEEKETKPPVIVTFGSKTLPVGFSEVPGNPSSYSRYPMPTPYATIPLRDYVNNEPTRFVIRLSDGLICQTWHEIYDGKEVPFPTELRFRNNTANIKRLQPLLHLVEKGHTCKAFAGMSRSKHGMAHDKQTHVFLRFGRTVDEDAKYLPVFLQEQEDRKREDAARQKVDEIWKMFVETAEWTDYSKPRPAEKLLDPPIGDVEAQMTPDALETWHKWDEAAIAEARKKTLRTYVQSTVFRVLMAK